MNNSEIASGYTRLDKIVPNWNKAHIIIIAGRPAIGKTAFALSLARNIAIDQRIPLAFFSMEMSEKHLKDRFVSNICELDNSKIIHDTLNREEKAKYKTGIEIINESPIFIDDTPGLSTVEFSSKARHAVCDLGAKSIFVDYLQLMNSGQEHVSERRKEISSIIHSIREIAEELGVPIIINTFLSNRTRYSRTVPCLADIERVGNIERKSDVILILHRPEFFHIASDRPRYKGIAQIIVAKNIFGEKGYSLLGFMPEFSCFYNL